MASTLVTRSIRMKDANDDAEVATPQPAVASELGRAAALEDIVSGSDSLDGGFDSVSAGSVSPRMFSPPPLCFSPQSPVELEARRHQGSFQRALLAVLHQNESAPHGGEVCPTTGRSPRPQSEAKRSKRAGERIFLVDANWWNALQRDDGVSPHFASLDNSALLLPGTNELKPRLVHGFDYVAVCESAWTLIQSWFPGSGPAIERTTRANGAPDLYPLLVTARTVVGEGDATTIGSISKYFSSDSMVCVVVSSLMDALIRSAAPGSPRLGRDTLSRIETVVSPTQTVKTLVDWTSTATLESLGWSSNQQLIFVHTREESAMAEVLPALVSNESGQELSLVANPTYAMGAGRVLDVGNGVGTGRHDGLTGLENLGNTCYMNAALQCLSHCPPLTAQFLGRMALRSLNPTAKLGYKGEAAKAFDSLLGMLWSGKHASVAPRGFKSKLDQWTSMFRGWRQHDSQELLSFVLDALHEDLSAMTPSLIDDIFSGTLRSHLQCGTCGFVSPKDDQFRILNLEIPTVSAVDPTSTSVKSVVWFPLAEDGSWLPARYVPASDPRLDRAAWARMKRYPPNEPPPTNFRSLEAVSSRALAFDGGRGQSWEPVAFERTEQGPTILLVHRDTKGCLARAPVLLTGLTLTSTNADLHALVEVRLGAPSPGTYTLRRTFPNRSSSEKAYDVPVDQSLLFKTAQVSSLVYICDWSNEDWLSQHTPELPPPKAPALFGSPQHPPGRVAATSLLDCLAHFTKEEVLDGDNMWKCPKCDALRVSKKRIDIHKPPNVLVAQLKRFTAFGSKISVPVAFERELHHPTMGTYDLFAVLRHHGSTPDGGHYDACVSTSKSDDVWRIFDDSRVSAPVPPPDSRDASSAYVLFYRSKSRQPRTNPAQL